MLTFLCWTAPRGPAPSTARGLGASLLPRSIRAPLSAAPRGARVGEKPRVLHGTVCDTWVTQVAPD